MKKLILTVLVGVAGGQLICWILSFSPNVKPEPESVFTMIIVGPIIALATIYGPWVYEKIMDR